jgi:hypothetical protein
MLRKTHCRGHCCHNIVHCHEDPGCCQTRKYLCYGHRHECRIRCRSIYAVRPHWRYKDRECQLWVKRERDSPVDHGAPDELPCCGQEERGFSNDEGGVRARDVRKDKGRVEKAPQRRQRTVVAETVLFWEFLYFSINV